MGCGVSKGIRPPSGSKGPTEDDHRYEVSDEQVPAHIAFIPSFPAKDSDKLDLETEYEIMQDLTRDYPDFQFSRWRASMEHIQNAIDSGCFCFHFAGHGDQEKGLCIEGDLPSDYAKIYLDGKSLRKMFQEITPSKNRPRIVFLAACHSEVVGEKLIMDKLVNHAVVCRKEYELDDNVAPIVSKEFYRRLLRGESVLEAFERAKGRLREIVKWRVHQALSILKGHIFQSAKLESIFENIRKRNVPFGKSVYEELSALCSQKDVGLEQEQKEEIRKLIGGAYVAEKEVKKYKLLPCVNIDGTHNAKYKFEKPERQIQSQIGWIPKPLSFFSMDLVRKQYKDIVNNCRLSIKNDHAVLVKVFAKQWVEIVGGKDTGKTSLATAVAWRMRHDNDGPTAIFWVDLSDFKDKRGILSAVAESTSSDQSQPLQELKNIAKSKRILLICDDIPTTLPGPHVFHEILKISKSLLLLSTSRIRFGDLGDSLVVKMNPTLNKERFKRLFCAYLQSTSIRFVNLKNLHFSTLYKGIDIF